METPAEKIVREVEENKRKKVVEKEETKEKEVRVMGPGIPYLYLGITFMVLAFILPIYKKGALIFSLIFSIIIALILKKIRKRQVKKYNDLHPKKEEKEYSDEIANKLYILSDLVLDRAKIVKNKELKNHLSSITISLSKMADEVENDENNRSKVRKLANYYGDMLLELIDKYIEFEDKIVAAPNGEEINTSMNKISESISKIDSGIDKLYDSLFSIDAMEISANINTLEKLMDLELDERK